jgi:hypothetical protein
MLMNAGSVLCRRFDVIDHDELDGNLPTLQTEAKLLFHSLRQRRGELSRQWGRASGASLRSGTSRQDLVQREFDVVKTCKSGFVQDRGVAKRQRQLHCECFHFALATEISETCPKTRASGRIGLGGVSTVIKHILQVRPLVSWSLFKFDAGWGDRHDVSVEFPRLEVNPNLKAILQQGLNHLSQLTFGYSSRVVRDGIDLKTRDLQVAGYSRVGSLDVGRWPRIGGIRIKHKLCQIHISGTSSLSW